MRQFLQESVGVGTEHVGQLQHTGKADDSSRSVRIQPWKLGHQGRKEGRKESYHHEAEV